MRAPLEGPRQRAAIQGTGLPAGADLVEQRRFDIAAADDGDGGIRRWKIFAVAEPGSGRDRATRLGRGLGILRQNPYGAPDLLFRDRDNVIDIAADMLK